MLLPPVLRCTLLLGRPGPLLLLLILAHKPPPFSRALLRLLLQVRL